jgi:DNA-binding ferritin-like protein (Dps family)
VEEELLDGLNKWKDVQEIVRLTFKGLSDVVRCQGEEIRQL